MRRLTTRGGGPNRLLDDLIQNVLVTELIDPSPTIWLLSPWVSDIAVIDNRSGEFASLLPGLPARRARLTEVLLELARRGSQIRILMRNDPKNDLVRLRLADAGDASVNVTVSHVENLHDKGLLTSRFHVYGSMNFTYFGKEVNEEGVTVTADQDQIARANLDYQKRFAGS
jgi:phosphatidylserine/phosphatidylglycerophosphate/cardiolipin synthase-like enzyme